MLKPRQLTVLPSRGAPLLGHLIWGGVIQVVLLGHTATAQSGSNRLALATEVSIPVGTLAPQNRDWFLLDLKNGDVGLTDARTAVIHRFNSAGKPIGLTPLSDPNAGAIGILGGLQLLSDTLYSADVVGNTFSRYELSGKRIGGAPFPSDLFRGAESFPALNSTERKSARFLGNSEVAIELGSLVHQRLLGPMVESQFWVITTKGELRKPMLAVMYPQCNSPVADKFYSGQFFCARPVSAMSTNGQWVAVAQPTTTGSDSGWIRLTVADRNRDTLYSRKYRFDAVPVTGAAIDSAVHDAYRPGEITSEDLNRVLTLARAHDAKIYPPVRNLFVGDDGSVWMQTPDNRSISDSWLVIEPQGSATGVILLPKGNAPFAATSRGMWLIERDTSRMVTAFHRITLRKP